jgi:hypothetical protein
MRRTPGHFAPERAPAEHKERCGGPKLDRTLGQVLAQERTDANRQRIGHVESGVDAHAT